MTEDINLLKKVWVLSILRNILIFYYFFFDEMDIEMKKSKQTLYSISQHHKPTYQHVYRRLNNDWQLRAKKFDLLI